MEEFFTRDSANKGTRLNLVHPDGTPTEHWLHVIGVDSDTYQRELSAAKRKIIITESKAKEDFEDVKAREEFLAKERKDCEIQVIAALVIDWSFEQECNMENKMKFLLNAPQIAQEVDEVSADRKFFLPKKPKS